MEQILDALTADPERTAVEHESRRMSAKALRALVYTLARAMADQGVRRGQTVTLLSGNHPEALATRYAASLLGCRVNHLYQGQSARTQAAIVDDVETRVLIADPRLARRAVQITEMAPVELLFTLGPASVGRDLLDLAGRQPQQPLASDARPQDVCLIRHTGGTTGHPKGICLTYARASAWMALDQEQTHSRLLVCTTLAHLAGALADKTLHAGGCVVLLEDFDAGTVLAAIERERITDLFVLPCLLYQLADHPDAARRDLSSLTHILYGGHAASPARLADALRLFGQILVQVYGQMEAGVISVLSAHDHDLDRPALLRSVGQVLPSVEVAVMDSSGRHLPAGEVGEICVRSPTVMAGYWKRPELTAEVLRDGWLHTGDVGSLDHEGYLTVLDRLKDVIKVHGGRVYRVYTTELEDVLNAHQDVQHSAVFGVQDADGIEQVHAAVVPVAHSEVSTADLRQRLREHLGPMYVPASLTFVDDLPLNSTGKPDKQLLRSRARDDAT
ncbi:AMP-binding protein [Streptomyces sp. ISL-100]|uniref:AMP-binding protein n=1 Tax=Streptomyces sp. ISL-100 TaxID=2819173 RepID=UPI0027E434A3|nr:AMP-binding protein [Streptomyces sp. ISL-100]